jgi:hypothetical protein
MGKLDQEVYEAVNEVGRSLLSYAHRVWKPQRATLLVRLLMAEAALYLFIGAVAAFTKSFSPEKQAEVWATFQERADELYERVLDGDAEVLRLYDA